MPSASSAWRLVAPCLLALAIGIAALACGEDGDGPDPVADPEADPVADPTAAARTTSGATLTVYSGRTEALIAPLLKRFTDETGVKVNVRYADTAALAATLLEEKDRSPADVYIAQDAGALGSVERAGLLAPLDRQLLDRVPASYRSSEGRWVGISGRVRVIVYNTKRVDPATLPQAILGLTDPRYKGKVGWAPTNGSFQAFVTALRLQHGEQAARGWLAAMKANGAVEFPNNPAIVNAVGSGEIALGLVNHYYLHQFIAERGRGFEARNHYTAAGDVGTLVNVAGAGILRSSKRPDGAYRLLEFLLNDESQKYFSEKTYEYPLVRGVPTNADLQSLDALRPPAIDLSKLEDLQQTLKLLRDVGVLK